MATLVTHAALPLIIAPALDLEPDEARRVTIAAMIVACVPDLDTMSFLVDVQARDPWGHRGAMHSLIFALLLGGAAMTFLPKRPIIWAFILGSALSHGVLDWFTHGDQGVALFAPFTAQRFLFPWGPIPMSPLGIDELFSRWGAAVLFGEALVVLVPAWLIVRIVRLEPPRLTVIATVLWGLAVAGVGVGWPGLLQPLPRIIEPYFAEDPLMRPLSWMPRDDLPDGGVVTRFDDLKALGLFDTELVPRQVPWSSSFFPSWYGGEAGRWQDTRVQLIARTLFGFRPPTPEQLTKTLARVRADGGDEVAEDWLERLSPTEKYDLAVGAYGLPATMKTLGFTHNGQPRYWHGLCNGVATAAMNTAEPFRAVDVMSPSGDRIHFLPNDIKALLAESYFWMTDVIGLKLLCGYTGLDSARICSMNAGAAVLATLNRLGIAHASYLVDVHPTKQAQLYGVARGRVSILRGPYAYDGSPISKSFDGGVDNLVDVDLQLVLSSTTLSYEPANQPLGDGGYFAKVGLVPVRFSWPATLALSDAGEIVGGRWTGTPPDGPDTFLFTSGGPELLDAGTLKFNPTVRWEDIQALARASVDTGPTLPTITFRAQ